MKTFYTISLSVISTFLIIALALYFYPDLFPTSAHSQIVTLNSEPSPTITPIPATPTATSAPTPTEIPEIVLVPTVTPESVSDDVYIRTMLEIARSYTGRFDNVDDVSFGDLADMFSELSNALFLVETFSPEQKSHQSKVVNKGYDTAESLRKAQVYIDSGDLELAKSHIAAGEIGMIEFKKLLGIR